MNLDDDAKLYIYWDAILTFNPTGSTVALKIDGVQYPMIWVGSPLAIGTSWAQTARTVSRFRGTLADTVGAPISLTAGKHVGQPIVVTLDGQVVPCVPTVPVNVG